MFNMTLVLANENSTQGKDLTCVVKDTVKLTNNRFMVIMSPDDTVSHLYNEVSKKSCYVCGTFDIVLISKEALVGDKTELVIDEATNQKLAQLLFPGQKNFLQIRQREGVDVDIAQPSTMQKEVNEILNTHNKFNNHEKKKLRFVGLVNQAMTCYLNSLIQTLFMTPEFRNALYRWEFDRKEEESTSIPYQLQHLFLLLQNSTRQSVETTGLTRSFGWDSSEAWQQHDIQELCRVMFDALEKKFEGTDQADLIKRLYEGKMKDYVQCCECSYESARDDTFLDIPITIRPFASSTSYKSVMEGLNAFVEPETLDESNQYFCERCAKKCNAKKGLKFIKFPYLLTLQLKRFDFDYSTMHRIKLNDRMQFPQILDLNPFVDDDARDHDDDDDDDVGKGPSPMTNFSSETSDTADRLSPGVCDEEDVSSHDSGQDHMEQTGSAAVAASASAAPPGVGDGGIGGSSEEDGSSVDEGIDVGANNNNQRCREFDYVSNGVDDTRKKGPYVYELFSIMVHSGSAAGGHYYAYIKSFENDMWYSFNDQMVSPITQLDIEKSFGGASYSRSTYYSSFSSSTNAYMLMYRQINKSQNADFLKTEELPAHIKKLMDSEARNEEKRKLKLEQEKNMCSIRLFCRHPSLRSSKSVKPQTAIIEETFEFHKDVELEEAVKLAHEAIKLDADTVEVGNVRLVKYDHINDALDRSYDLDTDDRHKTLSSLLGGVRPVYLFDLLLETKEDHEVFEHYLPGGITIKVHMANHQTYTFDEMCTIRFSESNTVHQLRLAISKRIECPSWELIVAYEKYSGDCILLQHDERTLKAEGFYRSAKVFVDVYGDKEKRVQSNPFASLRFEDTRMWSILDHTNNLISIQVSLPAGSGRGGKVIEENGELQDPVSHPEDRRGDGSEGEANKDDNDDDKRDDDADAAAAVSPLGGAQAITQGEIRCFWQTPELVYDGGVTMEDVESQYQRRRTNSCDSSQLLQLPTGAAPLSTDFPEELQRRLQASAFGMRGVSPTSSLKCEDGDSNHSEPGSLNNDMDFDTLDKASLDDESDSAYAAGYQQASTSSALASSSERSSLSTSCSTLDSTDTLCNPQPLAFDQSQPSSAFTPTPLSPAAAKLLVTGDLDTAAGGHFGRVVYGKPSSCELSQEEGESSGASGGSVLRPTTYYSNHSSLSSSTTESYNKALLYADNSADKLAIITSLSAKRQSPADTDSDDEDAAANTTPRFPDKTCGAGDAVSGQMKRPKQVASGDVPPFIPSPPARLPPSPPRGRTRDVRFSPTCDAITSSSSHLRYNLSSEFMPNPEPDSGEHEAADHENASMYGRRERDRQRTISASSDGGWGIPADVMQRQYYFKVVTSVEQAAADSNGCGCKVLQIQVDKRMPLILLKKNLVKLVGRSSRRFCIYKICSNKQEVEMTTPTDDLRMIADGTEFTVRFGRALRKDEHRCKIYKLQIHEEETSKLLFDWVIQRNLQVSEAKLQLQEELAENCDITVPSPDHIRLRRKTWRSPGQVFAPHERFGADISIYGSLEFFVEILPHPEPKVGRNQLVLLCRRWRPSLLAFDRFHEVVLSHERDSDEVSVPASSLVTYTPEMLREKLIECAHDISRDNLVMAKGRGVFPYCMNVLEVDQELDWVFLDPERTSSCSYGMQLTDDGTVVFYKDRTEELKEVSESERAKIEPKLSGPVNSNSSCVESSSSGPLIRPMSYRRERALKIYTVDTNLKRESEA